MDYTNSLIAGIAIFKIGKKYVYMKPPSAEDKAFADFFSQEQYDDAIIDGIWTQQDAEKYLKSIEFFSDEEENNVNAINENIDNMRVDYFNHFYNSQTKEYIKKNIEKQREKQAEFFDKKYILYDKTCEYIRDYSKTSILIQGNAFLQNNSSAYLSFPISILYNKYTSTVTNILKEIRLVAKNPEWKQRWFFLKEKTFNNDPSNLTDWQISLLSWCNFYENIYQSTDCPSEEIIDDDIALDGWSIVQRRKRKEEEKKRSAEKMLPQNMKNSGEVFIPVKNIREAQDVMNLNNAESKTKIKMLKHDLDKNPEIKESDLTSTKQELRMQFNKMQKESRRR